jgi:hypothetical protein
MEDEMRVKVIEKNVYTFAELNDEQKKVVLNNLYDINVDHEWWDFTYDDAANIGLKITSFDISRRNSITGEFTLSADEVAANIIRDHGENCETYNTAQAFLDSKNDITMPDDDSDDFPEWEDKMIEMDDDFLKSLLEDYLIMLRKEYEYLTSEEAIIEAIEANEYEFDERGKIA